MIEAELAVVASDPTTALFRFSYSAQHRKQGFEVSDNRTLKLDTLAGGCK